MKRMIDLERKVVLGEVDWEFIFEMQGASPQAVNSEAMRLDHDLLERIPPKWKAVRQRLEEHLGRAPRTLIAFSDLENRGSEFKIEATFQDAQGQPLAFRRILVYDKDRFEDDYLGAVITDEQGNLCLAFGSVMFRDFGFTDAMPDIYFRIMAWQDERFVETARLMPAPYKVTRFSKDNVLLCFGTVAVTEKQS